jgi:hypothetical protein
VQDNRSEDSYQTKIPYTEVYQQHLTLMYQEEAHLQGDSQEEVSQDGDHQEVEDHWAVEDHRAEEHHLIHLPRFQCKALTSLSEIHHIYSQETGPNLKNSSHNGRCTKESTSLIT